MKINKFVTLFLILLVIVYYLVWQIKPSQYEDTSEFIPGTALLYAEQKNVEEFFYDLENSKLGRAIQSIDFLKIGKEIELKNEEMAFLQKTNAVIKNNWESEIINEIFGKKVAFALLQPLRTTAYSNLTDFLKANIVLITQPKHKAEILQIIAERYAAYKENISISTHQYGAYHIKRISIDDEILSAVVIDGLYLISFEEQQLRHCIDTFDGEISSLSENTEYTRLRDHYSDPDQFLFLSMKTWREFVDHGLASYEFSGRDIVEKGLIGTVGFAGFSYGAWKNNSLIKDRIIVLHNERIVNNFVEKQLKIVPSICDTLRLSPPDPLVFYWTNAIDFASLYSYYNEKVVESDSKPTELAETFKNQTGETVDQLLALLGKELSYIITSNKENNFLSIPYGIMLFKVENREKLETTLKKLALSYNFPLIEKRHGSVLFYSWKNSPQDGFEPLYGFFDNYLFIGNSISLAKDVIDRNINGINVVKDPRFLEIDIGLTEANNYISYTNNVGIINIFKSLSTFASTIIAIEDKAAAKKISILTKDVLHPLLEGLTVFERTSTRGYITESSVVIESMTKFVD